MCFDSECWCFLAEMLTFVGIPYEILIFTNLMKFLNMSWKFHLKILGFWRFWIQVFGKYQILRVPEALPLASHDKKSRSMSSVVLKFVFFEDGGAVSGTSFVCILNSLRHYAPRIQSKLDGYALRVMLVCFVWQVARQRFTGLKLITDLDHGEQLCNIEFAVPSSQSR